MLTIGNVMLRIVNMHVSAYWSLSKAPHATRSPRGMLPIVNMAGS